MPADHGPAWPGGAGLQPECDGAPRTCELLSSLSEGHAERCRDAGIAGPDAMVSAAAAGIVIEVRPKSPVENMHASRRGPSDAAMFAESTALHIAAVAAFHRTAGLLGFEEHLLDRNRPWAGSGGRTLPDLGYGNLGDYRRHVKDRINALTALADCTCVPAPLETYLIPRALMYGRHHKGMPGWPIIVHHIGVLLADPDHPRWHDDRRGHQALDELPAQVTSIDGLTAALLTNPSSLPQDVVEWLSDHLLYGAGPHYEPGLGRRRLTSGYTMKCGFRNPRLIGGAGIIAPPSRTSQFLDR